MKGVVVMLLTIGMIVKNETENLARCLDSLAPLLSSMDAELIIVDTGSDDNTIEIAKRYTDDVRHFEWCKDFAAARNKSLENAKGEWFMFLDADEWFEDCDDIINFFKSGEYKKYNAATYIQRNYTKFNQTDLFYDYNACRMVKRLPQTKFVGIIHEMLNPIDTPVKHLKSFVHHYGYAGADNNDYQKKKRNIELLTKKLELEPDNMNTYIQLYDAYIGMDFDKAIECCNNGLAANENRKHDKLKKYYDYVFLRYLADTYYQMDDLDNAQKYIDIYFKHRRSDFDMPKIVTSDIDAYALKTFIACRTGLSDIAVPAALKYNELYDGYKKGMYKTPECDVAGPRFFNNMILLNLNGMIIELLCSLQQYSDAVKFRKYIPYVDVIERFEQRIFDLRIRQDIKIAMKLKDDTIMADIKKQLNAYPDKLDGLDKIIADTELECLIEQDAVVTESDIRKYTDNYEKLPVELADLIYIALKNSLPVSELAQKVDIDNFAVYYNAMKNKDDLLRVFMAYFEVDRDNVSELESAWFAGIAYFFIVNDVPMNDMMIVSVFVMYASLMMDYMAAVYNDAYINDENAVCFPKEIQIGYYSYFSAVAFDEGDAPKSVEYLKKAALIDNRLKNVVVSMGSVFKLNSEKKADANANSSNVPMSEFEMLAKQVKDNIRGFIAKGDKMAAMELINSYKELNPNDPEIDVLINEINPQSAADAKAEFEILAKQVKDNICRFISQGNKKAALELISSYKELNPNDPEIESLIFMAGC